MVFVLSSDGQPLDPCHEARARKLLKAGRAAVWKRYPFTIRLKDRFAAESVTHEHRLKIDPGSKTTGIAIVQAQTNRVVWAGELTHRGQQIRDALLRRRQLRHSRRRRKTRYRQARFLNRKRREGWLAPSLAHRVLTTDTWVRRLCRLCPISAISMELVRFDTQALQNPEISGIEYQRGTLFGYEVREYLLEKWGRKCAYCGAENVKLTIDHIIPKKPIRGPHGTDRISNLTIACFPCNEDKKNRPVEEFLAGKPEVLRKILAQAKKPLIDAAAVNATRYAIGNELRNLNVPVSFWSGGRTKFNRVRQDYPKAHWIDAACVGEDGGKVFLKPDMQVQKVKACGRGTRQVVKSDKYGFPRTAAGRIKRIHDFQTGDIVKLNQTAGKYAGLHYGRLAGIRATGMFDIKTLGGLKITSRYDRFQIVQKGDGYAYTH